MSLLCIMVVAVALVPACSLNSPVGTGGPSQSGTPGETLNDPNDFYYFDGKPIHLDRATSEFVVGVANETDVSQLLRGAPAPASVGNPIAVRGRRFVVVTLAAASPAPGVLALLLDAMRARPDVWFTSPIYYYSTNRDRVLPTDELIVRIKATVTPEALAAVLQAKGLRQVSRLDGTADQFLVRIESAKSADVLRVARELYETGLFQWAEPDFIRDLKREG